MESQSTETSMPLTFGSLYDVRSRSYYYRPTPPLARLIMYEDTYLTIQFSQAISLFMTDCPRGVFDERIRQRM